MASKLKELFGLEDSEEFEDEAAAEDDPIEVEGQIEKRVGLDWTPPADDEVEEDPPEPEAQPEPTPEPEETETMKEKDVRRGLKSDHWHGDEASFAQTSRLKKELGGDLKTWGLTDGEGNPLTKLQASDLIEMCVEGNHAQVRSILEDEFNAPVWTPKKRKAIATGKVADRVKPKSDPTETPVPSESANVDRDTAAELVALKRKVRELEAGTQEKPAPAKAKTAKKAKPAKSKAGGGFRSKDEEIAALKRSNRAYLAAASRRKNQEEAA